MDKVGENDCVPIKAGIKCSGKEVDSANDEVESVEAGESNNELIEEDVTEARFDEDVQTCEIANDTNDGAQ